MSFFKTPVIANITKVCSAGLLAKGLSFIILLLLPKFLSVEDYSYIQLYAFYLGFVGFFHFGVIDGIYLKIGGQKMSDLSGSLYASQLFMLALLNVGFVIVINIFGVILLGQKKFEILLFCCLSGFFVIAKTYILYLLQATNQIALFSRYTKLDMYLYFGGVCLALLLGFRHFETYVIIDFISKVLTFILCFHSCRDFLFYKPIFSRFVIREFWDNLRIGIQLMMANVVSILNVGIVRIGVETNWGVVAFGQVSLLLQFVNIFTILLASVGTVLFPYLRNIDSKRQLSLFHQSELILNILQPGVLLFSYPIYLFIYYWLPAYSKAAEYLILLFPVSVYTIKQIIIYNTYMKVWRFERQILWTNLISFLLSILVTAFSIYWFQSLRMVIFSILIVVGFRALLSEIITKIKISQLMWRSIVFPQIPIIVFILLTQCLSKGRGFGLYGLFVVCYYLLQRKKIKRLVSILKLK